MAENREELLKKRDELIEKQRKVSKSITIKELEYDKSTNAGKRYTLAKELSALRKDLYHINVEMRECDRSLKESESSKKPQTPKPESSKDDTNKNDGSNDPHIHVEGHGSNPAEQLEQHRQSIENKIPSVIDTPLPSTPLPTKTPTPNIAPGPPADATVYEYGKKYPSSAVDLIDEAASYKFGMSGAGNIDAARLAQRVEKTSSTPASEALGMRGGPRQPTPEEIEHKASPERTDPGFLDWLKNGFDKVLDYLKEKILGLEKKDSDKEDQTGGAESSGPPPNAQHITDWWLQNPPAVRDFYPLLPDEDAVKDLSGGGGSGGGGSGGGGGGKGKNKGKKPRKTRGDWSTPPPVRNPPGGGGGGGDDDDDGDENDDENDSRRSKSWWTRLKQRARIGWKRLQQGRPVFRKETTEEFESLTRFQDDTNENTKKKPKKPAGITSTFGSFLSGLDFNPDKNQTEKEREALRDSVLSPAQGMAKGVGKTIASEKFGDIGANAADVLQKITATSFPVVSAFATVAKIGFQAYGALDKFTTGLHDSNMKFAEFSGAMAQVQAQAEADAIALSQERGDRRAESAKALSEAKTRLNKASAPWEDWWANKKNDFAAGWNNFLAAVFEDINKGTGIGKIEEPKGPQNFNEWISKNESKEYNPLMNRPDRFR